MSQFRTEISLKKSKILINYQSRLFFIGSCFSDNIGNMLSYYKFPVLLNPFGVMYNPVSVLNALDFIIEKKIFNENDLHFSNGIWFSYYHHSSFSSPKKANVLRKINEQSQKAFDYLKNSHVLFVTFGTARYYRLKESGKIVANCHKQASQIFEHELLSVQEIVKLWNEFIEKLNRINPQLHIVFTLSPVRHWKDGAANNTLSKSILHVAIHELLKNHQNCSYFPSYEIMMDDLRDYRFYTDDFLHPNKLAIDYIWKKFCNVYIDDKTLQISYKIEKIIKAAAHRPFQPNTENHKKFLITQYNKIKDLQKQYPYLNFDDEINYFISK